MNYRTLGRTGLRVSALAMGTVELGLDYGIRTPGHYGRPSNTEATRLVHAALAAGINFLDTARAYGQSEAVLGQALRGKREGVVLTTKVRTQRPDGSTPTGEALRRWMLDSLHESLTQLRTEWVDLWQIHNLDAALLTQSDQLAEIVAAVRQAGKVRWVGASTYGVDLPAAAIRCGHFDTVQVTYSVLDQRLADSVLPLAAARNVGVIARSVLLQGALTARGEHLPDHLEPLRARSRQFRQAVAASGLPLTPAQAALAFALHQPQLGAVLVGVRSQAELQEDLRAVEVALPDELLALLHGLRLDDAELLDPSTWGIV